MSDVRRDVLARCQAVFPAWQALTFDDFTFTDPKGFSSFTMTVRTAQPVTPQAVLYRHLDGKENAILDFAAEKRVFLLLGAHAIAAHCYHYDATCRIEAFYDGQTLQAADLFDPATLRRIAAELHRLHRLEPVDLPRQTFFELLHAKWGPLARAVLEEQVDRFPAHEQALCAGLRAITSDATLAQVLRCLPDAAPVFCHNDTYHGNIMRLRDGSIKLLDFEFSCRNQRAFDFANLFAETVMVHNQPDYPFFRIAEPGFGSAEITTLVDAYLDHDTFLSPQARDRVQRELVDATRSMILLSDYMYAMAALPLAVAPIQIIRFIPYAHARFERFQRACAQRFGSGG